MFDPVYSQLIFTVQAYCNRLANGHVLNEFEHQLYEQACRCCSAFAEAQRLNLQGLIDAAEKREVADE